ncbi:MAG: integrase core domain-containing protein, partial [Pseudomonadota bacterium]
PVASPESNGVAEAFVKTLKHDYIRIAQIPDAKTALQLFAGWIEDYNGNHPHSGLKWKSPREFRKAQKP